jgi:hypothetical protein
MPMSYGTALKITTSRYYTPAGVCINGIGIVPDMVLKGPEQLPADLDDRPEAQPPLSARRAASPVGAATAASSASALLAQRDSQVGLALSLLRADHAAGLASSGKGGRVIGRLDASGTVR